jgi:hypothetical protein
MSTRPKAPSLIERIDAALADGPISYGDLARQLWPDGEAWSYSRNGGPPGCYMALSSGIRRGGFPLGMPRNGSNASRLVYPRTNPTN